MSELNFINTSSQCLRKKKNTIGMVWRKIVYLFSSKCFSDCTYFCKLFGPDQMGKFAQQWLWSHPNHFFNISIMTEKNRDACICINHSGHARLSYAKVIQKSTVLSER